MQTKVTLSVAICGLAIAAYSTTQDITKAEGSLPSKICIVENDKVFTSVADAIAEGIQRHGIAVKRVKGSYETKHSMISGHAERAETADCDANLYYVARYNWDIAYYMYFANIWVVNRDGTKRIAQATYDASRNIGLGKFIGARDKILELVDQMLGPGRALPASAPASSVPSSSGLEARLGELEALKKKGLISDSEYAEKRRALLNSL